MSDDTIDTSEFPLTYPRSEDLSSRCVRASQKGDLELLKSLMSSDPWWKSILADHDCSVRKDMFVNNYQNSMLWTSTYYNSMWWASHSGHLEVVKFLFSIGNGKIEKKSIYVAVARRHIPIIKFMIVNGSQYTRVGLEKMLGVEQLPTDRAEIITIIDMYQVNNE